MYCISNLNRAILFFALTLFIFAGCQKGPSNTIADADDNGGYESDLCRVERYTDDAISLCDIAGTFFNPVYIASNLDTPNSFGNTVTVSTDTSTGALGQRTLIIRFGNNDVKCLDGRYRRGNIVVQYYGEYADSLQQHTITFNNYYLDDIQLTGTILTTRIDTTVVGHWYYQVNVLDTLVSTVNTGANPNTYTVWNGTLVRQWITGYTTNDRNDDIFSISGWGMLYRANSHQFEMNIGTPLQEAMDCNFFESGVVNVSGYNGFAPKVVNYGVGACDPYAQLNITDTTSGTVHVYQITLTK